MQRFKIVVYALTIAICCANNLKANSADTTDTDETKRFDMPFIHIGVRKHADGEKDVDVRAPFVHVHNPAGPDNAQVKAPFTKVDHGQRSAQGQPVANKNTRSKTKVGQEQNKPTVNETSKTQ